MTTVQPRQFNALPFESASLSLGVLKPHPVVQRTFVPAHAGRIAKQFNENKLGTIWVTKRGRDYLVFDGQHRIAAIKEYLGEGWEHVDVPCRVYKSLDDKTCADLTSGINDSKRWTPIDKFRTDFVAGEAVVVDIVRILRGHGLEVQAAPGRSVVRAVGSLRTVYGWKPNGPEVLSCALGFLHEAWPDDLYAYDGELIRAFALLFQKYGQVLDRAALLHRMSAKHSPDIILGQGRSFAKATGRQVAQGVLSTIVHAYNTGRRSGKIEE